MLKAIVLLSHTVLKAIILLSPIFWTKKDQDKRTRTKYEGPCPKDRDIRTRKKGKDKRT